MVGVAGWDRAEVFLAVEPALEVVCGLVEADENVGAAEVVGEAVFAEAPSAVAGGTEEVPGSSEGVHLFPSGLVPGTATRPHPPAKLSASSR